MSENILADINEARYAWFLGLTKKIQKRFPGAYFGFSEEHNAWQIFSVNKKLLISMGISIKTKEFIYRYLTASGYRNGRTNDLKDLQDIYLKILEDEDAVDK